MQLLKHPAAAAQSASPTTGFCSGHSFPALRPCSAWRSVALSSQQLLLVPTANEGVSPSLRNSFPCHPRGPMSRTFCWHIISDFSASSEPQLCPTQQGTALSWGRRVGCYSFRASISALGLVAAPYICCSVEFSLLLTNQSISSFFTLNFPYLYYCE